VQPPQAIKFKSISSTRKYFVINYGCAIAFDSHRTVALYLNWAKRLSIYFLLDAISYGFLGERDAVFICGTEPRNCHLTLYFPSPELIKLN